MCDNETLKPKNLVRYLETKSHWYFARVRRVLGDEVELAFFDRSEPVKVPLDQVESVDEFFGQRQRTFSCTRYRLSTFFYRKGFTKLHGSRVREMKKALRRAGISFDPESWPTANTRIRLRWDGRPVGLKGIDASLADRLPMWIEPFVLPSGSRDPLGLQAPAERLVNEVLPGLTVFTFRAGYYGFLAWAIREVNGLSPTTLGRMTSRRELLNALERALLLCEFVHHGTRDDTCRLIGQRSKQRVLSSNKGDRYPVPASILKNQNSAGSFRLFSTSLVSLGLAEEAYELVEDGRLPFQLTRLGDELADAFARHVDPDFIRFAMGNSTRTRDTLNGWGRRLCFSTIARKKPYRRPLLRGLLLGNSHDAEKRYRTVSHLFREGLLTDSYSDVTADGNRNEEEASSENEDMGAGVSNMDVVLHFYSLPPSAALRPLQALSVFELLSLGLSAIFRTAVFSVMESGKTDIDGLTRSIASAGAPEALWTTPMNSAKPRTVKKLVKKLLAIGDAFTAGSVGSMLLLRILHDPAHHAVWDVLLQTAREPVELVDRVLRQRMDRSLADALPGLILAMVEHHELVSRRKNRQRWLFVEGDTLIPDDIRPMGLGLHALRFPQLGSLARDLNLENGDLNG